MMKIGSKAFGGGSDTVTLTHSGYTPAVTDRIIVTPRVAGNNWPAAGAHPAGNVKAWVVWDSTGSGSWKIKVTDSAFIGNVDYMIEQV